MVFPPAPAFCRQLHRLAALLILPLALPLGCAKKSQYKAGEELAALPASPQVDLGSVQVQVLGKLEGPYLFSRALSPTTIELADMQAKNEPFVLAGLLDNEYPTPAPTVAEGQPTPTPTPEPTQNELEARQKAREALWAFKMESLQKICGSKQLYLIRMSRTPPSKVYLFLPAAPQTNPAQPSGKADLLNARLLLDGAANMELEGVRHPMYDMMLDSQLTSVIKTRKQTASGDTLWGKYAMTLPPGLCDTRLAELEKVVY